MQHLLLYIVIIMMMMILLSLLLSLLLLLLLLLLYYTIIIIIVIMIIIIISSRRRVTISVSDGIQDQSELTVNLSCSTGELTGCSGFRRWSQARLRPLAAAVWLLSDTASCRVWAGEVLVQFIWFKTTKLQTEKSCE